MANEAYDDNGGVVSTAGDGTFSFDMQPRKYTLVGEAPIAKVRMTTDNRNGGDTPWSTYNALPIAKFEHTD